MIQHICLCERGCQRPENQDRAGGWTDGDRGLFFVADGVGGHYGGAVASQALADGLGRWWNAGVRPPAEEAGAVLQRLVRDCHRQILQAAPPGQRCGSTLVLLWLDGGAYTLLWAGDSRCYHTSRRLLRCETRQLTVDDVVPDSAPAAARGKLLRAVGVGDCLMSLRSGALTCGSLFALCSDGIYKVCPPPCLRRHLARAQRTALLQSAARAVEQEVLARRAPDNYSLVLIRPAP